MWVKREECSQLLWGYISLYLFDFSNISCLSTLLSNHCLCLFVHKASKYTFMTMKLSKQDLIFVFQIKDASLSKMGQCIQSYRNEEDAQTRNVWHFLLLLYKRDTVMKQPSNTWTLLPDVLEDIFRLTISDHNLVIHHKTDAIICFWLSIQSNCATNTCCIPSVNPLVYFTCMQEQQMFCLSELNSAPC